MNNKNLNALDQELRKITSTPVGRRSFLLAMPLIMSACATPPRTRYKEGDNTGQQVDLTVSEEERMTKEYLPKMQKDYPLYKNNYAQSYIRNLGNKIVVKNGLKRNPYNYNFRLVASDQVNAFALPAGEVFVTTGLLKMTESEAELAGVVGHEIGHIQARHTAERMHKAKKDQGKSWIYGLGGALLGGAAGFGLAKLICSKQDRECIARITKYGAAAGGLGGLLIQKYAFMAHSREDEMEADRVGFRTSVKAGFDSNHVGKFYEKLLVMEQKYSKNKNSVNKAFLDAMSTHPPGKDRVKQMKEMERSFPSSGRINGKSYLKVKKGIS